MANFFDGNAYGQNYATGGGFMAGGGGQSQGGSQGGAKSGDKQTLRPVTVQQVNSAKQAHTDADFTIDGQAVTQLTFVGIVRQITTNATNVIYQIEDGTGTVEARAWIEAESNGEKHKDIIEWTYIRVIGQIKSFQNRRYITAAYLIPVKDPNEIFYHKLDAMHVHASIKKEQGGGVKANGSANDDDRMKLDERRYDALENPIQRKIMQALDILAPPGHENGIHISALARRINGPKEHEIREQVEALIGEGFLYTAEDDDHILSTRSLEES